ncbi:SLC13 family permease [Ferrimonas pelagia]
MYEFLQPYYVAGLTVLLFALLALTRLRPSWIFSGGVLLLYLPGFISPERLLEHSVNMALISLLLLMIASVALERTRILNWVSRQIFRTGYRVTLLRMGALVSISSAFLNNSAVVASLIGVVRRSPDFPAQRLLIPLSYFAIFGGTLTLIGTSTNLVVNSFLLERGLPGFDFFAFLPVGLAVVFICGGLVVLLSFLLPTARVTEGKSAEYFLDAKVAANSPLIGKSVMENGLRSLEGLFLVEIVRKKQLISPVAPQMKIEAGDRMIFSGDVAHASEILSLPGVEMFAHSNGLLSSNLNEVLLSPSSSIVGRTLKSVDFRSRFDAAVVAIGRGGENLSGKLGDIKLLAGDRLVLAVGPDFEKRRNLSRNFFFLSDTEVQQKLKPVQEWSAIVGFGLLVSLAAAKVMSLFTGLLLYLAVMVILKVLRPAEIRRRIPFDIWIVIIGALCLADSFQSSGLAQMISSQIFASLGTGNHIAALAVIFLLTLAMTEVVTNNAAAALSFPLALAVAESFGVNYMPFVMAVAFGASASFLSPIGYQTNLMVMNAGNYHLSHFFKIGLPVSVVYSSVVLFLIPQFFYF